MVLIYIEELCNKYDYIIIDDFCDSAILGKCRYTYGVDDGKLKEINLSIDRKKDYSNFYILTGLDDVPYVPYKYENDFFESTNGYFDTESNEYKLAKNNYYIDYIIDHPYSKKDISAFKNIVELAKNKQSNINCYAWNADKGYKWIEKQSININYFIITDNNYYIASYVDYCTEPSDLNFDSSFHYLEQEHYVIYKYNQRNNSLDYVVGLKSDEINYFYENVK